MTDSERQEIFSDWLGQYKALVFKIVRVYAFTAMDRDDLFQEIALQIWNSIPSFQQASSASTWVYRVSINTAIKWMRKERRHSSDMQEIGAGEHLLVAADLEVDERLEWLYRAIQGLDKIDRSVALLMLDGFSYKEMALILGITESNVGVKINRIKKQLSAKVASSSSGTVKINSYGI